MGIRYGGRAKGTKNRTTLARENAIVEATADLTDADIRSMTALEIMQRAARLRAEAGDWNGAAFIAARLAPYVHPRLSAIVMDATISDADVTTLTDEQLAARIAHLESVSVH